MFEMIAPRVYPDAAGRMSDNAACFRIDVQHEEIRIVIKENLERYRTIHKRRLSELLLRLRFQGVLLAVRGVYSSNK